MKILLNADIGDDNRSEITRTKERNENNAFFEYLQIHESTNPRIDIHRLIYESLPHELRTISDQFREGVCSNWFELAYFRKGTVMPLIGSSAEDLVLV
jgi:hypothetical protein